MKPKKKRLLFVSPRFLFPADSGGKIRTSQILAGLKGGKFETTLVSPVPVGALSQFALELDAVADNFYGWPQRNPARTLEISRLRHLPAKLPISVKGDQSKIGRRLVERELTKNPDIVVFDFAHSGVLAPKTIPVPSIVFTHNIEAEIFRRHAEVASNRIEKTLWRNQLQKMEKYEREILLQYNATIAVSQRDKRYFEEKYGVHNVSLIRTGVDLEFFTYAPPNHSGNIVFTGSMDWLANIDGMQYLMDEVWRYIVTQNPDITMTIVGRSPPASLPKKAQAKGLQWEFTGYVDDIRPYVRRSCVYVVPLRVGGGTRIKVFEAMAMGCPVVSTSIGVEGLPVRNGLHYLRADTPSEFAAAVLRVLRDKDLRQQLSKQARCYVEENFSNDIVAKEFEDICLQVANENT